MKKLSRSVCAAAVATAAALGLGLGSGTAVAAPADPATAASLVRSPLADKVPAPTTPEQLMDQIRQYAPPTTFTSPLKVGNGKDLVTFGDSFTAIAGKNGSRGLQPGQTPLVVNCATDYDNWPKVAARKAGVSLGDWSCNGMGGAPLVQLVMYLESAIAYGDIGPNTKNVAFMYGGMDTFQWVDTAGVTFTGQPLTPVFESMMRYVKDRIRVAAPNAKVTLMSYPELANGDDLCIANLSAEAAGHYIPGAKEFLTPVVGDTELPVKLTIPGAKHIQESLRDNIKHAADANGLGFIDIYQATLGHGPCNPVPSERYTVGVVDTEISTMPNHPTFPGSTFMGNYFAKQVYNK